MQVLGVDGCKQGWVAVGLTDGVVDGVGLYLTIPDLLRAHPAADVVAVDIPIGLVDRGWRNCDIEARAFLRPRGSTVFPVPPRRVLEAPTFEDALACCRELTGSGISKQSFALARKILEVDVCAATDKRLHEVHPEVSFRELAGAQLGGTKKSWNGLCERRDLLEQAGIRLPCHLGDAGSAAPDDVLDAAVAAWSALRIARGTAQSLPRHPTQLRHGDRKVAIWS